MKQVRETAAGKSIAAWIILNRGGQEVATVQAHYGNSRVCVDVWATGQVLQQGHASGYGYDKFTAALRGLVIDGIALNDHCGQDKRTRRILKAYLDGKISEDQAKKRAERIGARFTNYSLETNKYSSLYLQSGLDLLAVLGYKVLQAI